MIFQMEILGIQGDTVSALKCAIDGGGDDKCNTKEKSYIGKVQVWYDKGDDAKAGNELGRLRRILSGPMTDDLRNWARRRAKILEQFVEKQVPPEGVPEL